MAQGTQTNQYPDGRDKAIFECRSEETLEIFEADPATGKLYKTRTVRQALAKVIKPVQKEGIDVFAVGKNGITQTAVTKDEADFFEMAVSDEDVVSDILQNKVLLQIESAVFKEGNKWRFNDGAAQFFAEIADEDFLSKINSGQERFGKMDVLEVDLQRIQKITDNGLKTANIIVKVHRHMDPLQTRLF